MYQDGSKPELKMDPHRHFNMPLVPYPNCPGSLTKEWDHNFGESVSIQDVSKLEAKDGLSLAL